MKELPISGLRWERPEINQDESRIFKISKNQDQSHVSMASGIQRQRKNQLINPP